MKEKIKIMVVDDDPDVLTANSRLVKGLGYSVIEASDGAECKRLLAEELPDLVLLDVILPDMDGRQLCKDIKSNPDLAHIFVVLTSGMKTSSSDQADGLEFGADGYIARPVSNREFKARVRAMVRILIAERERDQLIVELKTALSKVKRLSGLLPLCSYCKKIRNDKGYWDRIEEYIREYSEAELGDSICPKCAKTYFPGVNIYNKED